MPYNYVEFINQKKMSTRASYCIVANSQSLKMCQLIYITFVARICLRMCQLN
uniref:Uncharacterized protein n=1 Tax=Solanum lycopersicum TaxID=4081 RepID=A0A3Q7FI32_SOLLC